MRYESQYLEPKRDGVCNPFLTFKISKVIEAFKRFGRGCKPRPASVGRIYCWDEVRIPVFRTQAGRGLQPRS